MNYVNKYMITGILSIVPVYATYFITKILFTIFSDPGAKLFNYILKIIGKDDIHIPFIAEIIGLEEFSIIS